MAIRLWPAAWAAMGGVGLAIACGGEVAGGGMSGLDGLAAGSTAGGTSSVASDASTGGIPVPIGAGGTVGTGGSLPGPPADGYVITGSWHGYAWTLAVTSSAANAGMTTITPDNFTSVPAGTSGLCVQGFVGAASDYGGVAMLGVNVNQARFPDDAGSNPAGTVAIGGTAITVTYANPGGSVLRVQIQTPAGDTDATGRWCATLSGQGGTETVPWEQFWGGVPDTTQGCWNSAGNHPLVGTQIERVALVVPGTNSYAVPFSFCLQALAQAN